MAPKPRKSRSKSNSRNARIQALHARLKDAESVNSDLQLQLETRAEESVAGKCQAPLGSQESSSDLVTEQGDKPAAAVESELVTPDGTLADGAPDKPLTRRRKGTTVETTNSSLSSELSSDSESSDNTAYEWQKILGHRLTRTGAMEFNVLWKDNSVSFAPAENLQGEGVALYLKEVFEQNNLRDVDIRSPTFGSKNARPKTPAVVSTRKPKGKVCALKGCTETVNSDYYEGFCNLQHAVAYSVAEQRRLDQFSPSNLDTQGFNRKIDIRCPDCENIMRPHHTRCQKCGARRNKGQAPPKSRTARMRTGGLSVRMQDAFVHPAPVNLQVQAGRPDKKLDELVDLIDESVLYEKECSYKGCRKPVKDKYAAFQACSGQHIVSSSSEQEEVAEDGSESAGSDDSQVPFQHAFGSWLKMQTKVLKQQQKKAKKKEKKRKSGLGRDRDGRWESSDDGDEGIDEFHDLDIGCDGSSRGSRRRTKYFGEEEFVYGKAEYSKILSLGKEERVKYCANDWVPTAANMGVLLEAYIRYHKGKGRTKIVEAYQYLHDRYVFALREFAEATDKQAWFVYFKKCWQEKRSKASILQKDYDPILEYAKEQVRKEELTKQFRVQEQRMKDMRVRATNGGGDGAEGGKNKGGGSGGNNKVTCYNCGKFGHNVRECTEAWTGKAGKCALHKPDGAVCGGEHLHKDCPHKRTAPPNSPSAEGDDE